MKNFDSQYNIVKSIIILVFVLILGGMVYGGYLAAFGPQEGVITQKNYVPASYGRISGTPRYYAEEYSIEIKDNEGNYNIIYVDSVTFHEVKLGDYFDKKCMCVEKR